MNPHYSASARISRASLAILLLVALMSPAATRGQIVDFEDYGLPPGEVIDSSGFPTDFEKPFTVTAQPGDVVADISPIGLFAIDNVPVPQPGTLSLLAIGALGAIGWRRKPARKSAYSGPGGFAQSASKRSGPISRADVASPSASWFDGFHGNGRSVRTAAAMRLRGET